MSVLRNLETKLADLVEGGFGRMFRAEVRPVELARTARQGDGRSTAPSRSRGPMRRTSTSSTSRRGPRALRGDRARGRRGAVRLPARARARGAPRARQPPVIEFRTDERLGLGEFGIETRLAQVDEAAAAAAPEPAADGRTMVFSSSQRVQDELAEAKAARPGRAILAAEGKRFVIGPAGAVIGRSRDCDVVLEDSNVSRHHARIAFAADGGWTIEDLGLDERRARQRHARQGRARPPGRRPRRARHRRRPLRGRVMLSRPRRPPGGVPRRALPLHRLGRRAPRCATCAVPTRRARSCRRPPADAPARHARRARRRSSRG